MNTGPTDQLRWREKSLPKGGNYPITDSHFISHMGLALLHYTGCPRRKGPNFGRVFLRSNYYDITQNTYIQSSMVTEISAREV